MTQEAAERITSLQQLPFRLKQAGNTRFVEYDTDEMTGHRTFEEKLGGENPGKGWADGGKDRNGKQKWVKQTLQVCKVTNTIFDYHPGFESIVQLMEMFRALEASVSGIKAERDELATKFAELEGTYARLEKRCAEYKRQAEGGKKE